jgi:hypothetical protein
MVAVSLAEKAAAASARLKEHSITARIRRAIGNAMLDSMDVHTGAKVSTKAFPLGACNDLRDSEIGAFGMLPM